MALVRQYRLSLTAHYIYICTRTINPIRHTSILTGNVTLDLGISAVPKIAHLQQLMSAADPSTALSLQDGVRGNSGIVGSANIGLLFCQTAAAVSATGLPSASSGSSSAGKLPSTSMPLLVK